MPGLRGKSVRTSSRAPARTRDERAAEILADLDTQLMLQVQQGDRDAANTLVRRNFPRITRYIARLIGHHRPVEDVAQDVFLAALTNAQQYEPTAKFTTWLYRIATNRALNYLKQPSVRRQAAEPPDGPIELPDHHAPSPDRKVDLDELRSRVTSAIQALPINQRAALTLFEYENCSYEQIATVMEVTVEAVRSLLMRARTTLRGQLRDLI